MPTSIRITDTVHAVPDTKALVYNDDDWDYMATEDADHLEFIYDPIAVTAISGPEHTTTWDYINNRLTAPYEFIFIRSHGWPGGHGFYRDDKTIFDRVYSSDYRSIDPEAVFYSLYVCSGADFTANDYLAGTIAFNPDDSGLLSIGSTKTGGMWYADSFYSALGNRSVFGEAFRQWFNAAQDDYASYAPPWWYGMVLIGDGALVRSAFLVEPCESDYLGDGDVDGSDVALLAAAFGVDKGLSDLIALADLFGRTDCP